MKRGQMEIIGIAIVVILVSLGMLFMVSFSLQKDASKIKQTYTHTEMASNIINTMLNTKTTCKGMLISELMTNCAKMGFSASDCDDSYSAHPTEPQYDPDVPPMTYEEWNNNTCSKADAVITHILNLTLSEWDKPYHFYTSGIELLDYTNKNCDKESLEEWNWSNVESKTYILPLHPGVLTITLDICS